MSECREYRDDQVYSFGLHINPLISVEDDIFLREGWGCVNIMIFISFEFLRIGLTEKALFQVTLGLLLVYAD